MTTITEIKIVNLFGQYNYLWKLYDDVNILSGPNGSRKTTILRIISSLCNEQKLPSYLVGNVENVEILFSNGDRIIYSYNDQPEASMNFNDIYNALAKDNNGAEISFVEIDQQQCVIYVIYQLKIEWNYVFIESFDQIINLDSSIISFLSDAKNIGSLLNQELEILLSKVFKWTSALYKEIVDSNNYGNSINKKYQAKLDMYKDVIQKIDKVFEITGKKCKSGFDFEIVNTDKTINYQNLSGGEKQYLKILFNILISSDKPIILFLDEAENSLHMELQGHLLKDILSIVHHINDIQIICTTHSPGIIRKNFQNNVMPIDKILK